MNPTLAGIVALTMWSTLPALVVLSGDVPPFQLVGMTIFIGMVMLVVRQVKRGEDVIGYWKQPAGKYLFVIAGLGGYTGLIYTAIRTAPPFEATALNYLWPVLLVLFTALAHGTRLGGVQLAGIVAGFAGMTMIFLPQDGGALIGDIRMGHILAVAGAVLWAVYSTATKKVDFPQGFMAPVFAVIALLFGMLHLSFEETVMPAPGEWAALALLGAFRISYSFWDFGMKKGNVVLLASLSYFVPLAAVTWLILIGEVPHEMFSALGAGLIVGGCLIVNGNQLLEWRKRRRAGA